MYEIEKHIPVKRNHLPQRVRNGESKYPFASMVEGDSFFIPDIEHIALGEYNRKHAATGYKFIARKCAKGVRVWLVREELDSIAIDKDIPVAERKRGFMKKES